MERILERYERNAYVEQQLVTNDAELQVLLQHPIFTLISKYVKPCLQVYIYIVRVHAPFFSRETSSLLYL